MTPKLYESYVKNEVDITVNFIHACELLFMALNPEMFSF